MAPIARTECRICADELSQRWGGVVRYALPGGWYGRGGQVGSCHVSSLKAYVTPETSFGEGGFWRLGSRRGSEAQHASSSWRPLA